MKNILIISSIALSTYHQSGCNKNGCGDERDVQRHDNKPFRAVILKPGTITDSLYIKTILVSAHRSIKGGFKSLFVTENGDTITRYENKALKVGECYLVLKNI